MGVQHVGLFVRNVRDVGETYDIVRQRELPMMMTLGQHAQDPHLSFYHSIRPGSPSRPLLKSSHGKAIPMS